MGSKAETGEWSSRPDNLWNMQLKQQRPSSRLEVTKCHWSHPLIAKHKTIAWVCPHIHTFKLANFHTMHTHRLKAELKINKLILWVWHKCYMMSLHLLKIVFTVLITFIEKIMKYLDKTLNTYCLQNHMKYKIKMLRDILIVFFQGVITNIYRNNLSSSCK